MAARKAAPKGGPYIATWRDKPSRDEVVYLLNDDEVQHWVQEMLDDTGESVEDVIRGWTLHKVGDAVPFSAESEVKVYIG